MARSGMSTLINRVRGLCNVGTGDYTLGTETYWTDDQVQEVLDRYRITVVDELLSNAVTSNLGGGSIAYYDYRSNYGNYEETTAGTAIFIVEESDGTDIGTAQYTVDYANGIVTFGSDQAGSTRVLQGRSYDIYSAAGDIWSAKAGAFAEAVDFKTDNMEVDRGDKIENALNMADHYYGKGKSQTMYICRDDGW